jgi:hypothetical protein
MQMRQFGRAASVVALLLSACSSDKPAPKSTGPAVDNPISLLAGSGSTGSAGSQNPNRCVEGRANTSRVTPRVILVLDGSCSMSTDYPANGAASVTQCTENAKGRWAALRKAIIDPQVGIVPKLQHVVQFGVGVFGTVPMCPFPSEPVKPALDNLATIEAKMPTVQPGMNTPTGPALDWVYSNLIVANQPDDTLGPQIVILATDGEPNSCGGPGGGGSRTNYQPSIDAVNKGTKLGAKTYVVSLADSSGSFHDHLQELANLGDPGAMGNATLYTPDSPDELAANLQLLVGGAVGCDIALNGTIDMGNECSGTVTLNGTPITCNGADGWKLLDSRHIRLQGAACKELTDKNGIVDARFPCSSFAPD